MARLSLRRIVKRFGDVAAVDGVSLEIAEGEFVALLGPSGCGKTTTLRLVAGFERVSEGEIALGGAIVSAPDRHVAPERRRVGIVFQSYALWPHMTVEGNVGYPLRVARVKGEDYGRRVGAALATVGLADLAGRRPAELSGGQMQRVALARCLVMGPAVVLLDEPLANLDVHLRAAMQEEFRRVHRDTGATMLYITHDQAEAMALADRIAVMDRGRLVQVDDPIRLYREPASVMVAGFIGKGAVVAARVTGAAVDGRCSAEVFGQAARLRCRPGQAEGPVSVCLRPEDVALDGDGVAARVKRATYKGGGWELEVVPEGRPDAALVLDAAEAPAANAAVRLAVRGGWVIPG